MNHGYEYDVNVINGAIWQELTYVEPGGVRTQIMRQVLDTMEHQTKDALIELGWTPPTPKAPKKCIVKGCSNWAHQGHMIGDLCAPCHHMITTGNGAYSATFIGDLHQKALQLSRIKSAILELTKETQA